MKKHLITLSLLSAGFILCSCGEKPVESSNGDSQNETSSSIQEIESSSNGDSSVTSDGSSEEEFATAWSEEDLADMETYLAEGFTLPFATGLTTSYINASGTDYDGECFIVYDYECGDLSASYGKILADAGYTWEITDEDDGVTYTNYYYPLESELASIYVQYYYDEEDESFNIFAWREEGGVTNTFPYSYIQEYFELEITLSDSNLPSFTLAEGESYDAYSGGNYFYVGGYFDENTDEDAYVSAYEASLTKAGYTVDSTNALATNENVGLNVEYMTTEGYFIIQLSKVAEKPALGDHVTNITCDYFANSYADADSSVTIDSVEFKYTNVCKADNYVQFKRIKDEDVGGELYNVTNLGTINSIVITSAIERDSQSYSYYSPLSLYVSDSQITSDNVGTKLSYTIDTSNSTDIYTYNVPTGYSYFKLIDESTQYASKNSNIAINYTIE